VLFAGGAVAGLFISVVRSSRWSFICGSGIPSSIHFGAGLSIRQWSNHSFIRSV
jgi:hypothetical protein